MKLRAINLTTSTALLASRWKTLATILWRSVLLQVRFFRALLFYRPDIVYVTANPTQNGIDIF